MVTLRRGIIALLIVIAAIVLGLRARAFISVSQLSATPTTGVFDNSAQPWPFFNQINAVNYDRGGNGIAFKHVYNPSNCTAGTSYRTDFTNFNTINDSGATLDIGCFVTVGDYLTYTITISQPGPYVINMRAGELNPGASWAFYLDGGSTPVTSIAIQPTGGYQVFQTFTSTSFTATQGNHTIRLQCASLDTNAAHGCGDVVFIQGAAASGVTPPGPAIAAGFTTLADNYDFSNSLYAVNANWLDCPNTTGSHTLPWHAQNYGTGVTNSLPCNFAQVVDSLDGSTVMRTQYLTSYDSFGLTDGTNIVGAATYNIVDDYVTRSYPSASYIESVFRMDSEFPNQGGGPNSVWWWQSNGGIGSGAAPFGDTIECDFAELFGGSNGFADAQCGNHANGAGGLGTGWTSYAPFSQAGTSNLPSGWSILTYHKYGLLFTTDGATNAYGCQFVDDILQYCWPLAPTATEFSRRMWLIMGVDSFNPPTPANLNLYVKYIHVFSCSSWVNSPCFGTNGFVNTTQNGRPLQYYH